MTASETTKELLSEHRFRIKLYDHILEKVRQVLSGTTEDSFPTGGNWSVEEFSDRLHRYESVSHELLQVHALLAFWGEPYHRKSLTVASERLAGQFVTQSGLTAWVALRWYPIFLLLYSGGIAAVSARRYDNLSELLLLPVLHPETRVRRPVVIAAAKPMLDLQSAFKMLPEHDRLRTPRSEYIYKLLQPTLEAALSLGSEYETNFDEFEILYALEYAHQGAHEDRRVWGPPGRFAWKYVRADYGSPYHILISEAKGCGSSWGPVKAGLFGGSIDRFMEVATQYGESLAVAHWH